MALNADNAEVHFKRGNALREPPIWRRTWEFRKGYCGQGGLCRCLLQPWQRARKTQSTRRCRSEFDKAIALKADVAEAYYNRGVALKELNQLDAAIASNDKAIALKADFAEAYVNRGVVLKELNQLDAALASYDKAIALKTDFAEAYWSKSLALLLHGQFDWAWELFEYGAGIKIGWGEKREFVQPLWLGEKSIAGKTILLHSELAIGDTIQFCRACESFWKCRSH